MYNPMKKITREEVDGLPNDVQAYIRLRPGHPKTLERTIADYEWYVRVDSNGEYVRGLHF